MDACATGRFLAAVILSLLIGMGGLHSSHARAAEALEIHVALEQPRDGSWNSETLTWLTRLAPRGTALFFYTIDESTTISTLSPLANGMSDTPAPSQSLGSITVEKLLDRIANQQRQDTARIVLLTDSHRSSLTAAGMPRQRPDFIRSLQQSDVALDIIAMGGANPVLQALTALTNGTFRAVTNRVDGERAYAQLLQQIRPGPTVPIVDALFRVDRSIESLTLLLFRPDPNLPAEFMSPALKTFSQYNRPEDIAWYASANFEIVHFSKPLVGTWHVATTQDAANRVFADSGFAIAAALPDVQLLARHELPVPVQLVSAGAAVTSRETLDHLVLKATHLVDGKEIRTWFPEDAGTGFDASSDDGVYTLDLTRVSEPGLHEVVVDAETLDAQRRANIAFHVVDQPIFASREERGDQIDVYFYLRHKIVKPETTLVSLVRSDPTGGQMESPVAHLDPYVWHATLSKADALQTEVNVSATDSKGKTVSVWLPLLANNAPAMPSPTTGNTDLQSGPALHVDPSEQADSDADEAGRDAVALDAKPSRVSAPKHEHSAWRTAAELAALNLFLVACAGLLIRAWRVRHQRWLNRIQGELGNDPA